MCRACRRGRGWIVLGVGRGQSVFGLEEDSRGYHESRGAVEIVSVSPSKFTFSFRAPDKTSSLLSIYQPRDSPVGVKGFP